MILYSKSFARHIELILLLEDEDYNVLVLKEDRPLMMINDILS